MEELKGMKTLREFIMELQSRSEEQKDMPVLVSNGKNNLKSPCTEICMGRSGSNVPPVVLIVAK